ILVNGNPSVRLGLEVDGRTVGVITGTYIFLKFDAIGFEFSPPGIVEPISETIHLPEGVIGILRAVNPGVAKIVVKAVTPPAAGGNGNPNGKHSPNWSGYIIDGGPFTKIVGHWTVPTVTNDAGSHSDTWVGIDGHSSEGLIQAGTTQDWNSGVLGI